MAVDFPYRLEYVKLQMQYKVVLPACDAKDCTAKPNLGWVCSSPTKQGVKDSTRAMREERDNRVAGKRDASALSLDLNTFNCRSVGNDFDGWLADSKRVWDQLRFRMAARSRIKKQRRRINKRRKSQKDEP